MSLILLFVVRTVFIRTLGRSYLGINGLFSTILSMLSLAELGIGTAIVYRLYKPLATNDEKQVRVLIKFYKLAYRVIGLVIFVLGILLIPFLPILIKDYDRLNLIGIDAVLLFLLFLVNSVSSYLFFAYRSTVLNADQKRYIIDIVTFAINLLKSILEILALIFLKDFIAYVGVSIVCSVVKNIIIGIVAKRRYPNYFTYEPDSLSKREIKDLFKDCGALLVYKVNDVVIKASDNLVLSSFVGLISVGMYSNYYLLHKTLVALIDKFFSAFKASMGNLFATEAMEVKYRFFKAHNFLTVLLYGTAGVGLAVCSSEFVETWIGKDYVLRPPIPTLIGIEVYFAGIITNLAMTRNVSGIFRQAWYRPLIASVINIVVSVALVTKWGISGVILGTLAAKIPTYFFLEPILIYKYAFKHYRSVFEYFKINLLYITVEFSIAVGDMWFCSHMFVGHGWFSVLAHVFFTGFSVPTIMIFLFWKTDECVYLRNIFFRIIKTALRKRNLTVRKSKKL